MTEALLSGIIAAQSQFAEKKDSATIFEGLLDALLNATGSEYGFIGEVLHDDDGNPFLRTHAITNIAWDDATRRFYDENAPIGMRFTNLESLFGRVLTTEQPVVANSPGSDPRRGGLPEGHPPLDAFLGLPISHQGKMIGMVGIANRRVGYDDELIEFIEPIVQTCANTIAMFRIEAARREAERAAELHRRDLASSRDHLLQVVGQMEVGVVVLDQEMNVSFISDRPYFADVNAEGVLGRPWEHVFPANTRLRRQMEEAMRLPRSEGERIRARWTLSSGANFIFEIDVRSDPRDESGRILYFYDRTELSALRAKEDAPSTEALIGESEPIITLLRQIGDVARGDWNVLIEGETGAGKELVARAVHAASPRRDGPYVAVNCAGLTDSLLGSQLFGHRRGAFTGAVSDQQGLFESARGGTLFLDEIGDVSPKLQMLLLRAIQEKEILRVGDTRPRAIDVRILAATHRQLTEESGFRADLLYRIRTGRISVPALRDRRTDIPLLCQAFLARGRVASGRTTVAFSKKALSALCTYPWPGNVRELKAAVEHCLIHGRAETIEVADLPPEVQDHASRSSEADASLDSTELVDALQRAKGNRTQAARILGIGRATLYRRMRALNIEQS